MLARAFSAATTEQRVILDMVGSTDLDDAAVARIQQVVIDTGALEEMESVVLRLRDRAIGALDSTRMAGNAHDELVKLADSVTRRDA